MSKADRPENVILTENAPSTVPGILKRLGPGLIIAGSIVGSGELIGTTITGAQAGFALLWLIIIGCVIKVFVQVEFGRFAISTGQSSMSGMNETPGPRIDVHANHTSETPVIRANWLAWYWLLMFLVSLGQLGGIVGGVGQAMSISIPLTEAGREYNREASAKAKLEFQKHLKEFSLAKLPDSDPQKLAIKDEVEEMGSEIKRLTLLLNGTQKKDDQPAVPGLKEKARDHQYWAILITIITSILLVIGRYGFIQWASTLMVAGFTLVTVINVAMLQMQPEWAVSWADIWHGLSFHFPPASAEFFPVATALATFGIIGVGANELIQYPYWCLEKGYARFVGPRDGSPEWAARAQGWLRVLRWDAWCSMIVYTFATIAFYLLGAAILGRIHLMPKGMETIRTLSIMYEPVFGKYTPPLFLFGAFAVLYSTFFVASAGHARVCDDAIRVFSRRSGPTEVNETVVKWFSGVLPFVCLAVYLLYPEPTTLVLASGAMQAIMLPMLSFTALYFRYTRVDERIRPGKLWDIFLWLSAFGMLLAGGWLALTKFFPALEKWL